MNGDETSFMMTTFGATFHDFAGSAIVHSVGGVLAFVGAIALGPRLGKYGKDGKSRAIPGHNLLTAALGVFILWFGWFGFNAGSQLAASGEVNRVAISHVFLTTNLAAAAGGIGTMFTSWIKYGKPSFSLTLNGVLAGLVAITAGCDLVSPLGAAIIGLVAGIILVFSIEFIDSKLHIDDPVGAVGVHMANGVWGTIAVGLFSAGYDGVGKGLFYGGGFKQLGLQLLGFITIQLYALVVMFVAFLIIDKAVGLRVSEEIEINGLDYAEHGLTSAYSGFAITDVTDMEVDANENTDLGEDDIAKASQAQINAAVKVRQEAPLPADLDSGMHKVTIICRLSKFDALKKALNTVGVTGMTMSQVMGSGIERGSTTKYRGATVDSTLIPKVKVEVIIGNIPVDTVIDAAKKTLYTGHIGDGKIFVYNVAKVVKVRTGEEDLKALADVE